MIEGDSTLALVARREIGAAREVLERYAAFEADTLNDSTLTPDAKDLAIYLARAQSVEKATAILAKAGDAAHAAAIAAEKALANAARPSTTKHEKEIRQHVARLPLGERDAFLQKAASRGDVETVEAVLGAPRYLSGLDDLGDDAAQSVRELAMASRAPLEMEALREARQIEARSFAAWQASLGMRPARNERLEALRARAAKRGAFKV